MKICVDPCHFSQIVSGRHTDLHSIFGLSSLEQIPFQSTYITRYKLSTGLKFSRENVDNDLRRYKI